MPKSITQQNEEDFDIVRVKHKNRPYVLMIVKQLRENYPATSKKTPITSWGAKKLIEMLVGNEKHSERTSKNKSECLNQELKSRVN